MLNKQISMVLDEIEVAFELLRELEIAYCKFHMKIFEEFLHFILFSFRSEDGNI
jgi:hypothetical protein